MILSSLWKTLGGIRAGLVLLMLTGLASIAGSVISPLERAQSLVFATWWFRSLLVLLMLSMISATLRSVAKHWKPGGRGFAAVPWAAVFSHAGVLVMLAAGFASEWVSFRGSAQLLEGEETASVFVADGAPGEKPRVVPLGFTIRCDDFETAYFPRTKIPSKYVSSVTILENGAPVASGPVEVNRGISWKGFRLHQTSCSPIHTLSREFQQSPAAQRFRVDILKTEPEALPKNFVLATARPSSGTLALKTSISRGQHRLLPELDGAELSLGADGPPVWTLRFPDGKTFTGPLPHSPEHLRVRVEQFEPDFVLNEKNQPASRSEELNNPAALLSVREGDVELWRQWVFGREDLKPLSNRARNPVSFDLTDVVAGPNGWRLNLSASAAGSHREMVLTMEGEADLGFSLASAQGETEETPPGEAAGPWRVRPERRVECYLTEIAVTRNPAVPVAYAGFVALMAGLLWSAARQLRRSHRRARRNPSDQTDTEMHRAG